MIQQKKSTGYADVGWVHDPYARREEAPIIRIRQEETVGRLTVARGRIEGLYGELDRAYAMIERLRRELARWESAFLPDGVPVHRSRLPGEITETLAG
jgi:hypothetical protein